MNITFLWFCLIPIICACALYFLNRQRAPLWLLPVSLAVGVALTAGAFAISYGSAVADTEIWNGQITGKERVHGTYIESYQCNCRTVSSGSGANRTTSTQCDTCFRTHYTVHWYADSTLGRFTIDSRDSLGSSVYSSPDPGRWVAVQAGEPAAMRHSYTNYVQAVPTSLYAALPGTTMQRFKNTLPPYPDKVYDFYRCDRLVQYGVSLQDASRWNQDIALMLRTLGPKKQVNLIISIAKTADTTYADALRAYWEGVNKNDVVVVLGTPDGQVIEWVRIISWTKNELFKIELRDALLELGRLDREAVMPLIQAQITKNFERRHMKEFEYLKGQIDPPDWLLTTLVVVLLVSYGGAHFLLNRR